MTTLHEKVTRELPGIGAAWATRSDKFLWAGDPLEDQIAGRKTYHIHPDAGSPHVSAIMRFDYLWEILDWIKAVKTASEMEPDAAYNYMQDFWAGLE